MSNSNLDQTFPMGYLFPLMNAGIIHEAVAVSEASSGFGVKSVKRGSRSVPTYLLY